MMSEAQKTKNESNSAIAVRGSLQVLNLGPLLVGQLAQAINWSNDAAFKRPECKPWVDLPPDSNLASTQLSPPEAVLPDTPSVSVESGEKATDTSSMSVDAITEVSVTDESTANVDTRVEDSPSSVHEPEMERLPEHDELDSLDGKIQADSVEISRNESSASAIRSDDVSKEVTPTPTVSPEAVITKEEYEEGAAPVAMIDQAIASRSALDHSQSKTEHEPKLDAERSPKTEVISSQKQTIVPDTDRPVPSAVETVELRKVQSIAEDTSLAATEIASRENLNAARIPSQKSHDTDRNGKQKPHLSQAVPRAERVSLARSSSLQPKVDQSQDDYLLQLERLVVELNMELAQVRGEQTGVDPLEQMANRIIALNLENLALREKLQQSNP